MRALSQNGYGDKYDGTARLSDTLALSPFSARPLFSLLCSYPLAPQLSAGPPVGPFPPAYKVDWPGTAAACQHLTWGQGARQAVGGALLPARCPACYSRSSTDHEGKRAAAGQ